jgi:hypothetical protein
MKKVINIKPIDIDLVNTKTLKKSEKVILIKDDTKEN